MSENKQGNDAKVAVNFGTIHQTNVEGGDATKSNQEEILALLHGEKKESFLQEYFREDWESALQNPQTYHNLKDKLLNSNNSLESLLKEKEELLAKFESYHLNEDTQKFIDSAVNELRYDDAEKILADYLDSTDKVAQDRLNAHYQKSLVHLEKIEYYKARDEIENIPSKKVEDPKLLNDYAIIYELCGNYTDALPLYEKALKIYQKVLGEEHPNTAICYNNLAGFHYGQSEFIKAYEAMKKALDIRKKVLPENHPYLKQSIEDLASIEAKL